VSGNRRSNAPGFGNGHGTLKQPTFSKSKKKTIFLPSVPKKVF